MFYMYIKSNVQCIVDPRSDVLSIRRKRVREAILW